MKKLFFLSLLSVFTLTMATPSKATNVPKISFQLSFSQPQAHYVDVLMEIKDITANSLTIKMPVWAPGSYMVREFSKNVEALYVKDVNGKAVLCTKSTKNSWVINTTNKKSVVISYKVYAFEASVRTSFIDQSHAFISSPDIFMHLNGHLQQPVNVKIIPFAGWEKTSTALNPLPNKPNTFFANNFDELYDCPIEIGNQDIFYFEAAGVNHQVAMVNGGNYNTTTLKADMAKIVETATAVFGQNPNKSYVFIVHNYANGGGGLEHKNSTVLGATRLGYTNPDIYIGFLSLVAHEYFHLWNVKRLRPIALGPFDYDKENYTTNLWVAEGFTAYYENLICQRAGIINKQTFFEELEKDINAIANQPGNKVQTLSEASFNAWIKYYRPNENSGNTSISYYSKGALIATVVDLTIIHQSNGKFCLDDAMQYAYNYYHTKLKRGYTDAEFKAVLEKFAGKRLNFIYDNYINGTADIDFSTYLGFAGLQVENKNSALNTPYLGANASLVGNKFIIKNVAKNTAAYQAGLNVNDVIITVDGLKIDNFTQILNNKKPDDELIFWVDRDGIEKTITVKLKANTNKNYVISNIENHNNAQEVVMQKWLK